MVAAVARSLLGQAVALVDHVEDPAGWAHDRRLLVSTGRTSMPIAATLAALPGIGEALAAGGRMLDVGTGVAFLAIALARTFPALEVVGLDRYDAALALAREHVAASGVADRVQLREGDVTALGDVDAFDAVWLPGPFLPHAVCLDALGTAHRALRPGGWLVFGLFGAPPEPLPQAVVRLRTLRAGGHPWSTPDAVAAITAAGFHDAAVAPRAGGPPVTLVLARKP
jgi:ubiquinone/menaquinone biosynthesis C-methylase UbiE